MKDKSGFLSYHATHIGSYGIQLNKVQEPIRTAGFECREQLKKEIFHWSWIEESIIFNFNKKK